MIGNQVLIHRKAINQQAMYQVLHQSWRSQMPLDSILVAIAVTMMFVTFAVVLGWGERQTRKP
jgi:hypothetical protein